MTRSPRGIHLGRPALLACVLVACASTRAADPNRPELALKRGSAWATYSIQPPRIVGPTANLRLEGGRLRGVIASRALDLKIEEGAASGFGPGGPVNLTIARDGSGTRVEGMWNGAPLGLSFEPQAVKGSVVVWQGQLASQQRSCSYNLDKVEPNGAISGSSTCAGMPQQTRLEVHAAAALVLSPSELVVLLVAALSAPPMSGDERRL